MSTRKPPIAIQKNDHDACAARNTRTRGSGLCAAGAIFAGSGMISEAKVATGAISSFSPTRGSPPAELTSSSSAPRRLTTGEPRNRASAERTKREASSPDKRNLRPASGKARPRDPAAAAGPNRASGAGSSQPEAEHQDATPKAEGHEFRFLDRSRRRRPGNPVPGRHFDIAATGHIASNRICGTPEAGDEEGDASRPIETVATGLSPLKTGSSRNEASIEAPALWRMTLTDN